VPRKADSRTPVTVPAAEVGADDCEGAAEEAEARGLLLALTAAEDDAATEDEDERLAEDDEVDEDATEDEADGPSEELVALAGPVGKVALAAGAETVAFGRVTPAVSHEER
jgi:succinyl-CoA synthetase beta subunit